MRSWLAIVMLCCAASAWAAEPVAVEVDLGARLGPLEIDKFALGQGGLSEEPMWEERVEEIRALRPRLIRLFIQEYFDLLPERGKYHFDTLDQSVDLILKTGAKPLMCITFKPKVLYPEVNQDIVEPNDYAEWERLIEAMVRHYKERGAGIQYWEVVNEPDIGESGGCPLRFKPDNYARFYRHTVEAVLRADPEAKVGGPALASWRSPLLPALLDMCEKEKVPLHFVSWHIYSSDPKAIGATIVGVKELLKEYPSLTPETILDEWNMALGLPPRDPRIQPCFIAETAWRMKDAGLDYSCYYHIRDYHVSYDRFVQFMSPGGTAFMTHWWNRKAQFDGLFDYQNTVRPSYFVFKLLSRLTGERVPLTASDGRVHGFATWDERYRVYNVLLWNFSSEPARVEMSLKNMPSNMTAGPVTLDAATASNDENHRLRPGDPINITREKPMVDVELEPYGVQYFALERRG